MATPELYLFFEFSYVRYRTEGRSVNVVRFNLMRRIGWIVTLAEGARKTEASWSGPALVAGVSRGNPAGAPLVLGIGNILLGDDGTGVRLVAQLQSQLGAKVATFIDGGTIGFALLSYVEATDSMLVVDAAELDSTPGSLVLFEGAGMDRFLASGRRRTVHEVGLMDLLDMARLQDCLPARRALLCIQPAHINWGEALSAPVEAAMGGAIQLACDLLERWRVN
jgi:hydrogenase maturation protease